MFKHCHLFLAGLLLYFIPFVSTITIGQNTSITFAPSSNAIKIASSSSPVNIILDNTEWPAVLNAAENLASDFGLVTGRNGTLYMNVVNNTTARNTSSIQGVRKWAQLNGTKLESTVGAIIAGTRGRSTLIDRLVLSKKLNAQSLEQTWESFVLTFVDEPIPGVSKALVIAGV
jgi:hypothetical protein